LFVAQLPGDIDIVGKQKAQSYYRTVLWNVSTIEMAVVRPTPTLLHWVV
jgi:hypothetical protein